MVDATNIKFYKSGGGGIGLGGGISSNEVVSGTLNNLFPNITRSEQLSGKDYYLSMYMKNTSTEDIKNASFWMNSDTPTEYTTVKWGFDPSDVAQTIADINTEPGVTWISVGSQPSTSNLGNIKADDHSKPIWIWWHVDAGAPDTTNDRAIFNFKFDITTTGTGSGGQTGGGGGTGTGGNPPPAPTNYKIAVVGDWGEENETDDVVNQIKNGGYNLVLGVGDNSYTSSDSSWYGIVKSIDDNQGSSIRFETAMGNHDSASDIKTHFGYKNTYTSFDFQNVHVLILDTESSMTGSQLTFAQNDLTAQDSRNNIDWIFVSWHRPAIGPDSDHPNNEEDQIQNYFDLFTQHGVNLVCQGHNHIWFRSKPVKRSGSGVSIVDSGGGPYTVGSPSPWLIAVTSGAGGHDSPGSLYSLDSTPSYSAYQNNSNNGILSVEASNNGQTLTCKFINTSGSVKHTWVMQK